MQPVSDCRRRFSSLFWFLPLIPTLLLLLLMSMLRQFSLTHSCQKQQPVNGRQVDRVIEGAKEGERETRERKSRDAFPLGFTLPLSSRDQQHQHHEQSVEPINAVYLSSHHNPTS